MKNENCNLDDLFARLEGQWDIAQPNEGHETRFLERQTFKKKSRNYGIPLSIAASILLLIAITLYFNGGKNEQKMQFASEQTRETDSVFNAMINVELNRLKEQQSPENARIIADACEQLEAMEADYDKIRKDLSKNGESKQIIYAMISNLQTRISFLQNVMLQIENNKKIKNFTDEKTI